MNDFEKVLKCYHTLAIIVGFYRLAL